MKNFRLLVEHLLGRAGCAARAEAGLLPILSNRIF